MSLQMKSYYAATVQAAMLRARQELGSDALLLHSQPTTGSAKHLGDFEVVFALGTDLPRPATVPAVAISEPPALRSAATGQDAESLRSEVAALKREMSRIAAAIGQPKWVLDDSECHWAHPEFTLLEKELRGQEMDGNWLVEVLRSVEAVVRPEWSVARVRQHVEREIERQIVVDSNLGISRNERQIVAFVGPAGAGKTTALVKLAARYGLTARRSAQILTLDVERVAAAEQLRSYAAILGLSFQLVDGVVSLSQALEESRHKQFVFIDTPGYGEQDADAIKELASYLSARDEIDIHLVVPAPVRSKDLTRIVDRFAVLHPGKLLITRLDETETIGALLNESRRMNLPISFLSAGQQIPEDLTPATAELLLNRLAGRLPQKAAAVA